MSDFRKTAISSPSRSSSTPSNGIVGQVVQDLTDGMSVAEVAHKHHVPRDFIEQIVDFARARGGLQVVELNTGCSTGPCDPDPDSIVCAGCPLVPAGSRNRATILNRLRAWTRTTRQKKQ